MLLNNTIRFPAIIKNSQFKITNSLQGVNHLFGLRGSPHYDISLIFETTKNVLCLERFFVFYTKILLDIRFLMYIFILILTILQKSGTI